MESVLNNENSCETHTKPGTTVRIINIVEYAQKVTELIRRSFATVADEFGLTPENCPTNPAFSTEEAVIFRLNKENCYSLGLFLGEELIGFAALMPAGNDAYEITRLAVAPEHRHKGYGKTLLDAAVNKAREFGKGKIVICIIDANKVLKDWYIQYCFIETGKKEYPHLPFVVCEMEKRIFSN